MAHVKVIDLLFIFDLVTVMLCSICTDIDECVTDTHSCDRNAMCTNTEGSFNCDCYPGFTGDGSSCSKHH